MKKPNILLITGDHVRSDVLASTDGTCSSASLADYIATPHLDALSAEGMSFRNCFSPCPICVPARAAITTGRYPHKCTGSKSNSGSIHLGEPKLAELFADNGYETIAIGKLHYLPYASPDQPRLLHGFKKAELCEEGRVIGQYDPEGRLRGLEDYHDYLHDQGWGGYERSHGIGNNDVRPGLATLPAALHEEAWVATRAIHHLDAHQGQHNDKPFLMWMSFTKPHPPYDPPSPYDRLYDPRSFPTPLGFAKPQILADRDVELHHRAARFGWDSLSREAVQVIRATYAGLMSFQDAMIGRVLSHLRSVGMDANTVVIYTADHGDLLGDFGRFFKSNMFDASVKVPLIIRSPGMKPDHRGRRGDQLVGLQDLLPTLCDLAEIDAPSELDGQSLLPVLNDSQTPGREMYVSQTNNAPTQKYMVRTPDWKYVYTQVDAMEELYDMRQTDAESTNLASNAEHRKQVTAMRRMLIEWCRTNEDHAMLNGDELTTSDASALPTNRFQADPLGLRKY